MVKYDDYDWKELPTEIRMAAEALGYNQKLWDKDKEPAGMDTSWHRLTPGQQTAATTLGYTQAKWDEDSDDSSSGDDDDDDDDDDSAPVATAAATIDNGMNKHHLLCVQLFIENNDYVLKVKKDVGLSMFFNRDFQADEIVFQSSVSPPDQKKLFQANPCKDLSPERHGFAERFLAWQETYGDPEKVAVGASECIRPTFTMEDFKTHCSDQDHSFPTPECQIYALRIDINDVVLVEFVPSPSSDIDPLDFPPERQFEILPYGENILWAGEEGYSPAKDKRPPTMCGHDPARTLELPGHFSNHACGASATVYDTIRLATPEERATTTEGCALIAPALPSQVQGELQEFVRTGYHPGAGTIMGEVENFMTTHRTLPKGTEVLTDYVLWHWSNADHIASGASQKTPLSFYKKIEDLDWDELPKRMRDAYQVLGYTESLYDSDKEPSTCSKDWKILTVEEREAAEELGYSRSLWRDDGKGKDSTVAEADHTKYMDEDWEDLPEKVREAAKVLGYTESIWDDDDKEPSADDLYWRQLSSAQQAAARTIGYTKNTWDVADDDCDMEPWFNCRCGDARCHAADGFRGVEMLPLEEQKRLYWVCSPWIQNQIDWKLHTLENQSEG